MTAQQDMMDDDDIEALLEAPFLPPPPKVSSHTFLFDRHQVF
jgi:hypothetical protein